MDDASSNLATVWEAIAGEAGDAPAVIQGERVRSWEAFSARAARLAGALAERGVGPSDKVAICCYNSVEYLETVFATFKLRAAPVNVNYRYREAEIAYVLEGSGARAAVFHAALGERVAKAAQGLGQPVALVTMADGSEAVAGADDYEELATTSPPAPAQVRSGDARSLAPHARDRAVHLHGDLGTWRKGGAVHRFRLGPRARVLDEHDRDVLPGSGQVGVLAVSGPMPKGYLNDSEKTAATWRVVDGVRYALPGDMARVEADGTLVLLGRGSEVVNTGGEKVFVEEVEQAIAAHPGVADVMVVGVPDDRFGQRVVAVVAPAPGAALSEQEVVEQVVARLADHKRPRQVVFVSEVLRSPSGKANRAWAKETAEKAQAG